MAGAPLKILNQATSQRTRWREAPAPHTVKVDGRSLATLLAFGAQYGALITFYDLRDTPDGDWSLFFKNDPSIALAMVASLDAAAIGAQLRREIEALKHIHGIRRQLEALRKIIDAILRIVRILDNGAQVRGESAHGLSKAIAHEIRGSLAAQLRNFALHTTSVAPEPGLGGDLMELSPLWGIDRSIPGSRDAGILFGDEWIIIVIAALEDLVAALVAALTRLSAQARDMLEASLEAQDHAPQSALYDAFVKLFGHAQNAVNTFPRRLVEFYYGTILKQDTRREAPDQVYLTFTPGKDIPQTSVPKATSFPAGTTEDGTAINYASDRSLEVYDSAVAALRTLRVTAKQVLSGVVALSDKPPPIAEAFPPFGASEAGTSGSLVSTPATLGFTIASNTLLLTAGKRRVELRLQIGSTSWTKLKPKLDPIAAQLHLTPEATLALLLQQGFTYTYTTAGGWMAVPGLTAAADTGSANRVIVLTFTLDTGTAPLVPLSTTPPNANATPPGGQVPSETLPALMAALIQTQVTLSNGGASVQVYPYPILAGLALETLAIYCNVQDFGALSLTTPNGPADPSQPFPTFGSPPVQNGALSIAAPELFLKQLNYLSVANGWYGIPTGDTGFEGYYRAYLEDADGNPLKPKITNTTFLGAFSVSNPGLWKLGTAEETDAGDPVYLFRTKGCEPEPDPRARLLDSSNFDKLPIESATPPAQYDPSLSAINLTLTEPRYAFGDTLYARNVMAAALRETSLAAACAQKCAKAGDTPPPEFVPLITAIDAVATANADAPDSQYRQIVADAAGKALSQMTGTALKLIFDALGKRPDLDTALAGGKTDLSAGDIARNLAKWLDANSAALPPATLAKVRKVLTAEADILEAEAETAKSPIPVARAKMAAALLTAKSHLADPDPDTVKECIAKCMGADPSSNYPNTPWLPMTASFTLHYAAISAIPNQAVANDKYYYLEAFEGVAAVDWTPDSGEVPLLQPQSAQGELLIGLSGKPEYLDLLLQITAGAHGFSSNPPAVAWAQQSADGWSPLSFPDTLLANGTEGTSEDSSLQNTGIVSLKLAPPPDGADLLWLKLSIDKGADTFPRLAAATTNATTASWIGPGGADKLGVVPLPAGTITAADPPLADIATTDQPLPSFGGHPFLAHRPFWMWMAERLRHKDRAIQSWDYDRLALSEFPVLWQSAALPAEDDSGAHKPGSVDLVVIAGPSVPNISDTTQPLADETLLEEIGAMTKTRCSTFITLAADNPRYVRITVTADIVFSPADTVAAWCAKLNAELIEWLSPWEPPPALGVRPADYYSDFAIADFIRGRPYVDGILSLSLTYSPSDETRWCYLTSALEHNLTGELAS
jgi:hypothetical protein